MESELKAHKTHRTTSKNPNPVPFAEVLSCRRVEQRCVGENLMDVSPMHLASLHREGVPAPFVKLRQVRLVLGVDHVNAVPQLTTMSGTR